MKTLRYRIRVIALALVCALLATVLWTAKTVWFPDADVPALPSAAVSSPPDPWAEPAPSRTPDPGTAPEETPAPDPLFDTTGL